MENVYDNDANSNLLRCYAHLCTKTLEKCIILNIQK